MCFEKNLNMLLWFLFVSKWFRLSGTSLDNNIQIYSRWEKYGPLSTDLLSFFMYGFTWHDL